jgi:uncharacterized GH25 family protein
MSARIVASLVSACVISGAAHAHDFWIEPSTFKPELNTPVRVRLRVGDEFPGDSVPRNDSRIEKFVLLSPDGETPVAGRDGSEPAGYVRLDKPGTYVLGYRSTPASVTLEAQKFEEYLRDEGLDDIIALRKERSERSATVRELYSRCAKSIIQTSDSAADSGSVASRSLGFRLELIAEQNPYALQAGDKLSLQILFEGKPCADRLLIAKSPSHPQTAIKGRTDGDGRAVLTLPKDGQWIVTAVHMVPAQRDSGADWESLWASLSFQLPARTE